MPSFVEFELIQQRGFPRRGVWISAAIASAGMILQVLMLRSKTPRNDQFGAIGGWAIQGVGLTRGVTLQHFREYVW